jgi:predicted phosphodiesterase
MRVAVLSDIHADFEALERVLDVVDRARADQV